MSETNAVEILPLEDNPNDRTMELALDALPPANLAGQIPRLDFPVRRRNS